MIRLLFRPIGVSLWLGLLLAGGLFVGGADMFRAQELAQYDEQTRKQTDSEIKFPSSIVLVEINNQSINTTERVPWSQGKIATLLSNIRKAKPKAVVLDLPLLRPRAKDIEAQLQKTLAAFNLLHPPPKPEAAATGKKRKRRPSRRQLQEIAERKALQTKIEALRKQLADALKDPDHARLMKEIKATPNLVLPYQYYQSESDIPGVDGRYYKKKQADEKKRKEAGTTPKPAPRKPAANAKTGKPAAKRPTPPKAPELPPAIELFQLKRTQLVGGADALDPAMEVMFLRENPDFAPLTRFHGFTNLGEPKEPVMRTTRLVVRKGKEVYPSLALAAAIAFGDKNPAMQIAPTGYAAIDLQSHTLPVTRSGKFWIHYYGARKAIPKSQRLLAGDILAGKDFTSNEIAGKLVLIGVSSTPNARTYRTPHHEPFSALELHATIAANLLQANTVIHGKKQRMIEAGLLLFLALLLGAISMKIRYFGGLLLVITLLAALNFANHFFLFPSGQWLHLFYVQFGFVVVYLGISFFRRTFEDKGRNETRSRFQPRMNEEDFKRVLKQPEALQLDGTWRPLTALTGHVSPLGAFLTEENNPKQITKMLPHLLNPMANAICRNKGIIGQLDGHGFQGLFNAPFDLADHPEHACMAALQMRSEAEPFSHQWQLEGLPTPLFGIGIDTGHAVTGNIGGDNRFHYSAVGAPIEGSARIEQINRHYGSQILLSAAVAELLIPNGRFLIRELDRIRFAQQSDQEEPTTIYELLGPAPASSPLKEAIEWYQHALTYYRARNFQEALRYFQEILRVRPDDGPAKAMLERTQQYLHYPPSFQWDGTWKLKS